MGFRCFTVGTNPWIPRRRHHALAEEGRGTVLSFLSLIYQPPTPTSSFRSSHCCSFQQPHQGDSSSLLAPTLHQLTTNLNNIVSSTSCPFLNIAEPRISRIDQFPSGPPSVSFLAIPLPLPLPQVQYIHSIVNIKQTSNSLALSTKSAPLFESCTCSSHSHALTLGFSYLPKNPNFNLCSSVNSLGHSGSLQGNACTPRIYSQQVIGNLLPNTPTMTTQDELIALFQQNLHLQNQVNVAPVQQTQPVQEQQYTYSISQHYHHSAHVASQQPSRPASEPPQTDQLTTEIILARHGVDVNSLFPAQIDLFKTADASQQMRLIELWRICPPNAGGHALEHDIGTWPATSFQQEESLAKLRHERQMLEERMSRSGGDQHMVESVEDTMSDASTTAPLTPIQGGDGRWQSAEPYMQSGYEALAARDYERSAVSVKDSYSHFGTAVGGQAYSHATDPVYKSVEDIHKYPNVGGDWEALMQHRKQLMEDQYGSYEQYHDTVGPVAVAGYQGEDEEML